MDNNLTLSFRGLSYNSSVKVEQEGQIKEVEKLVNLNVLQLLDLLNLLICREVLTKIHNTSVTIFEPRRFVNIYVFIFPKSR